jgi:hypothetical protein
MPVILATQEVEIRKIKVQSQSGQIVHKTYLEKSFTRKKNNKIRKKCGWWSGSG